MVTQGHTTIMTAQTLYTSPPGRPVHSNAISNCLGCTSHLNIMVTLGQSQIMTAQSALHFTLWQTCSFQCHLDFPGKHQSPRHYGHSGTIPNYNCSKRFKTSSPVRPVHSNAISTSLGCTSLMDDLNSLYYRIS